MADWKPQVGEKVIYFNNKEHRFDGSPKNGSIGIVKLVSEGIYTARYRSAKVKGVNGQYIWMSGLDNLRPYGTDITDEIKTKKEEKIKLKITEFESRRDKIDAEISKLRKELHPEPVGPAIRHLDLDD